MLAGKIFKHNKDKIEEYCNQNNLSFIKLCTSPCCFDNEELFILETESYPEREALGLKDNIPLRVTLEIYLENGKLRFEQTDITRKYLGAEELCAVAEEPGVRYGHAHAVG
jgi:hypothetical protein